MDIQTVSAALIGLAMIAVLVGHFLDKDHD
jgi:hypothetical protein